MTKRWLLVLIPLIALISAGLWYWQFRPTPAPSSTETTAPIPAAPQFNKQQYSRDDPASPWVIVNKRRPLPADYVPEELKVPEVKINGSRIQELFHLRTPAADALEELFTAAAKAKLPLLFFSGYRSEDYQTELYQGYVDSDGQADADKYSARPRYSEHQTGLAADVSPAKGNCQALVCFAATPEGKWVAANAYKYGFIIRYPKDKEDVTGFEFEPWHLRYVGKELAAEIHESGQTLEDFFGLPPAPDYEE